MDNKNISQFSNYKLSAVVNCELVLLSTVLLSLISIYGLFDLYAIKRKTKILIISGSPT